MIETMEERKIESHRNLIKERKIRIETQSKGLNRPWKVVKLTVYVKYLKFEYMDLRSGFALLLTSISQMSQANHHIGFE